jgi:hypothetical protein
VTIVGQHRLEHSRREQPADVSDQHTRRLAAEPVHPVNRDLGTDRLCPQVLQARPDIGGATELLFQGAVRIPDHRCVDSDAGHDGEPLLVESADVEPAARTMEAHSHGFSDVDRYAQISGEKVRRSRRHDREWDVGPCNRVDAALDDSVASPDEQQISRRLSMRADLGGRLAAFELRTKPDPPPRRSKGDAAPGGLRQWSFLCAR